RDYAGMIRLRLDGSESRAVAPDSIARAGDWSPDGEDIVFAAAHQTRYEQLYRISLQDGFVRQLTDDSILHEQISYSPDGRWIVYSYSTGQGSIIFRMRADGSDNRQLTGQDSSDGFPQWFPIIDLVLREWLLIAIGTVMSVVGLWRMYVI
ncbi:MAG TPA: hypothetical protein VJZ27_06215, partial [Aggregatilineales bacterium]|nr:hypothetical protein [Aggregatilineales bacterium]